jgi:hypothetical protein
VKPLLLAMVVIGCQPARSPHDEWCSDDTVRDVNTVCAKGVDGTPHSERADLKAACVTIIRSQAHTCGDDQK